MSPMRKGHSPEVVSHNVKELVKSGKKQKEAVAIALSAARKYKKMAQGGLVESPDFDEDQDSSNDQDADRDQADIAEMGKFHENEIANPEAQDAERMFAKKLFEQSEKREGYAMGGLVLDKEDGVQVDGVQGTEPDLEWVNDSTEEPMVEESDKEMASDLGHSVIEGVPMDKQMLSEEAMKALEAKKKKRRYAV